MTTMRIERWTDSQGQIVLLADGRESPQVQMSNDLLIVGGGANEEVTFISSVEIFSLPEGQSVFRFNLDLSPLTMDSLSSQSSTFSLLYLDTKHELLFVHRLSTRP